MSMCNHSGIISINQWVPTQVIFTQTSQCGLKQPHAYTIIIERLWMIETGHACSAFQLVVNIGAFTAVPQGTESTRRNIHKGSETLFSECWCRPDITVGAWLVNVCVGD